MAQDRVVIVYPCGKSGWELVKTLKALGIDYFGMSLGLHDEPELATIDGAEYVGFEAIQNYLQEYELNHYKNPVPQEP